MLGSRSTQEVQQMPQEPASQSGEIVSQKIFNFLYGKNETSDNYQHFLQQRRALPTQTLLQTQTVLLILESLEPVPRIDYENVLQATNTLQTFLNNTKEGPILLNFFTSLIKAKAQWLMAVAEAESFKAFATFAYEYYIISFPKAYTLHGDNPNAPQAYLDYKRDREAFVQSNSNELNMVYLDAEYNRIQTEVFIPALNALQEIKMSNKMWHFSSVLWECVEQYKLHLAQKKERDMARQRAAETRMYRSLVVKKRNPADGSQIGKARMIEVPDSGQDSTQYWMGEEIETLNKEGCENGQKEKSVTQ